MYTYICTYTHIFLQYTYTYTYTYMYNTGCPLKKVGAVVESMKESKKTKKSYTILPISQ